MLPLQLEDLEVIEKNLLQMLSDQTEEEKKLIYKITFAQVFIDTMCFNCTIFSKLQ